MVDVCDENAIQAETTSWSVNLELSHKEYGPVFQTFRVIVKQLPTTDTTAMKVTFAQTRSIDEVWYPRGASKRVYQSTWNQFNISWVPLGTKRFRTKRFNDNFLVRLEFRLFDEMMAMRMHYTTHDVQFEVAYDFDLNETTIPMVVADRGLEGGLYRGGGQTPLSNSQPRQSLPFSMELNQTTTNQTVSLWFSEACTDDTANALLYPLKANGNWDQGVLARFQGFRADYPQPASSFFVWQFAGSMVDLANRFDFAGLVCEEPLPTSDWDWVQTGKQVRLVGVREETQTNLTPVLESIATTCSTFDTCQYILVDAGWYGDEYNTLSDPMKPREGLNITEWIDIASSQNPPVHMIFYINDIALQDVQRVEQIAAHLVQLGVRGVKMGFVDVMSTAGMRRVIQNLKTFGRHQLVVNIHDSFRDHFLQRKYPHLLNTEGVAGDEHHDQDYSSRALMMPFARSLSGRVDYTFVTLPRLRQTLKVTSTFQVAKSIMITTGLLTIYWYTDTSCGAEDETSVYSVWNDLDINYQDSFYMDVDPGNYVSLARKQRGGVWLVAGLAISDHVFDWDLSFLDPGETYQTQVWKDNINATAITLLPNGLISDNGSAIKGSRQSCSVGTTPDGLHEACIVKIVPKR